MPLDSLPSIRTTGEPNLKLIQLALPNPTVRVSARLAVGLVCK